MIIICDSSSSNTIFPCLFSLFTKQVEFEEAVATIADRNEENQQLEGKIASLEEELRRQTAELERSAELITVND